MDITKFFGSGLKGTVKMKNGSQFSYSGPWVYLINGTTTRLDRWHMGSFMAAEYTIVAEFSNTDKEIIKCIVIAGPDKADLTIYGKADLGNSLITVSAVVNQSYIDINVTPITGQNIDWTKTKVIFKADYFQALNPIIP